MFERFTPRAREVIVRAQDESRRLRHNYIHEPELREAVHRARPAQ